MEKSRLVLEHGEVQHVVAVRVRVEKLPRVLPLPLHRAHLAPPTRLVPLVIGAASTSFCIGCLGLPSQGLLLQAHLAIAEVVGGGVGHVLNAAFLQPFGHDIEAVEDLLVVAFLKRVKLAVVGATVGVNLGLAVRFEDAAHGPFAVDEAAILDHQKLRSAAARAP